jgi:hypothetical protein
MYNYNKSDLMSSGWHFCTFGFYNHNSKFIENVQFTLISMILLILGGLLLDILEKKTCVNNSKEFYMLSFLA